MMRSLARSVGGLVAATTVAIAGRRRRSLSVTGTVAAVPVGAIVVAAGSWWWGVLLVGFFTSSSWLSRHRVRPLNDHLQPGRGSERDAVQVLANGAIVTLIAVAHSALPASGQRYRYAAFAGALAASTADTWATELGAGSRVAPRRITNGQIVVPGVSGAVTPRGTAGSIAGASFVAILAALGVKLGWAPGRPSRVLAGTVVAGIIGSTADSFLGATLQASYTCPVCGEVTEHRAQHYGADPVLCRGHPAITNDGVNLLASCAGALTGIAMVGTRSSRR